MEESSMSPSEEGSSSKGFVPWFKKNILRQSPSNLKTELEEIIQEHEDAGDTSAQENEILRNVLQFDEVKVSEVMTPRLDINAVPLDIELEELKQYVADAEHTRLPIYKENLDEVVGFLHIKDLINFWVKNGGFDLNSMVRELIYVPPTMKITDLLERMRAKRTHMAVVVDEYGGTDGLVTIEDLVEELVGEIEDEHDDEEVLTLRKINGNLYEVSARFEISKLEQELDLEIYEEGEDEDFDTIGGLIFTKMGKVPEEGEALSHKSGLIFEVVAADNRKIERVRIKVG